MARQINTSLILILGNGFDLQCDLESTYKSYMNWKYEKYSSFQKMFNRRKSAKEISDLSDSDIQELINDKEEISIWDLYFVFEEKSNKYANWFDVEASIRNSLLDDGFWDQVYSQTSNSNKKKDENKNTKFYAEFMEKRHLTYKKWNSSVSPAQLKENDEIGFYYALLDELKIYEKQFAKYLEEITDPDNPFGFEYEKLQNKNIEILKNTMLEEDNLQEEEVHFKIVSFNYTRIKNYETIYMHGSLDDGYIIFGIDSEEFKTNTTKKMFTKKERVLNSNLDIDTDNLFMYNNVVLGFYGLSFSEQDYPELCDLIDKDANANFPLIYLFNPKGKDYKESTITKFRTFFNKEIPKKFNKDTSFENCKKDKRIYYKELPMESYQN